MTRKKLRERRNLSFLTGQSTASEVYDLFIGIRRWKARKSTNDPRADGSKVGILPEVLRQFPTFRGYFLHISQTYAHISTDPSSDENANSFHVRLHSCSPFL